jgi:GH15 family glucan-1,4-alpha-glucosidase
LRIEDYALVGDTHSCALVSRDGSVDWLCLPRFDSGACFAALLGRPDHGRWRIAPASITASRRQYRPGSLVLETEFDTPDGTVRLTDCMPIRDGEPRLVRVVEGVRGTVTVETELILRFDYGSAVPWLRRLDGVQIAVAGPDAVALHSDVELRGESLTTVGSFQVRPGQRICFVLTWFPSHLPPPDRIDAVAALETTDQWWQAWSAQCRPVVGGEAWQDAVVRSCITLKALTYRPTGGIVAAATTSLPEAIGGLRNWDYRYCWIRDATFTLYAMLQSGFDQEAAAWRDWLLRAVAGRPAQMQILYGAAGERRLNEFTVDWLPGYEGSAPVRVGNAAHTQFQLDVYGEVMDTLDVARRIGLAPEPEAWAVQRELMDFLESHWDEPDEGIWEVRGPRRHFTHSKVMAWVAMDRAVRAVTESGLDGPVDRWRTTAEAIHAEVCEKAYDPAQEAFTQSYGAAALDASVLMMPLVGFLPATDPRIKGTVAAIERTLVPNGLVLRYSAGDSADVDGLPPGEGAFLPCSFWLADVYGLSGRLAEGRALFERLRGLANDVGLLSEEYDPVAGRQLGNFPQAFTHLALVNTARNLSARGGAARHRGRLPRR